MVVTIYSVAPFAVFGKKIGTVTVYLFATFCSIDRNILFNPIRCGSVGWFPMFEDHESRHGDRVCGTERDIFSIRATL